MGQTVGTAVNDPAAKTDSGGGSCWLLIVVLCLLACAVAALLLAKRKKAEERQPSADEPAASGPSEEIQNFDSLTKDDAQSELFMRIDRLMEEEQLYLNTALRVSDVAARLGSNTTYVSAAINSQRGCTFSQFLAAYRIAYAQKMMLLSPERKTSDISTISGFSTESTFFRAFRASTGMSPKEWLAAAQDNQQP